MTQVMIKPHGQAGEDGTPEKTKLIRIGDIVQCVRSFSASLAARALSPTPFARRVRDTDTHKRRARTHRRRLVSLLHPRGLVILYALALTPLLARPS